MNHKNEENKVGCVFPIVIVSILPYAEFGPNDHRKKHPNFIFSLLGYFAIDLYE